MLPVSRLIWRRNINTTSAVLPNSARSGMRLRMGCLKERSSLIMDLERELEEIEREGKEWKEMENCKGKTIEESGGMVELLECLEREAIMGNDEGRESYDYNRRAQIFHKSSKVFQALEQLRRHTEP